MKGIDRLVIAIKWFGLMLGVISFFYSFFIFDNKSIGFVGYFIAIGVFLMWFVPTWVLGWVINGDTSIIPYPVKSKQADEIGVQAVKFLFFLGIAGGLIFLFLRLTD